MELNPKEKAEELVDKMYNTENCGIKHFPSKHYCDCSEINRFQAIQCAIIDVKGNIDVLNDILLKNEIKDLEAIGNSLLDLIKYNREFLTHLNDMTK